MIGTKKMKWTKPKSITIDYNYITMNRHCRQADKMSPDVLIKTPSTGQSSDLSDGANVIPLRHVRIFSVGLSPSLLEEALRNTLGACCNCNKPFYGQGPTIDSPKLFDHVYRSPPEEAIP